MVLYLCSAARELRSGALTQPVRPRPKPVRRGGATIFPPAQPRIWETGYRIGATIRLGLALAQNGGERAGDSHGTKPHARPRPHLRHAHWHHYWTGPMKGERQSVLRWLHPILVAAGENGSDSGIVPVLHRVAEAFDAASGGRP
jgi:hypothetical protein